MHKVTSIFLDVTLYLLLFFMGVQTAMIPDISQQLVRMGVDALVITACIAVSTVVCATVVSLFFFRKKEATEKKKIDISWNRLRTPLCMIAIVVLGFCIALYTPFFGWYTPSLISLLLYGLLFLVGMQMVQHQVTILPLLSSPITIVLPLLTLAGTFSGALLFSLISKYTPREALTVSSGFGWYSLSGVLISSLGNPSLGALSFLSNLFRESFSFILIPIFSLFFYSPCAAISLAGATSMDVTLPLLKKSYTDVVVPIAMVHGVIMSLLSPFFIPLWFG